MLRWNWPLQPVLMLYLRMWKKTNSSTVYNLSQKKVEYSPSHSWVRCTIQCIACFCNAISGNPTAWVTMDDFFYHAFFILHRNFCKKALSLYLETVTRNILIELIKTVNFGKGLWKSLCAKGELLDASCLKYEYIHEERPLTISLGNIPHDQRTQVGSERQSHNLQSASQTTYNIQKVFFLFLPRCLMELCIGIKLFLKNKKSLI